MPIKKLMEDKAAAVKEARGIIDHAATENRQLTDDERARFDELENKVKNIDGDISRAKRAKQLSEEPENGFENKEAVDRDIHAFAAVLRARFTGDVTNANYGTSNNPYLIPTTIADRIERRIAELAPIYDRAIKYSKRGSFVIPVVDTSTDDVTVAYSTEFTAATAHAAATTGITLSDHAFTALVKISNELIDGTDIEIVDQVVEYIAEKVAIFESRESIVGTENKSAGICGSYDKVNMSITLADKDEITADDLIKAKMKLLSVYRKRAEYLMNPDTLLKIALLKDGEGRYLLDVDNDRLLGLPVLTDENMPTLGTASKDVVFCGDFSGLAVKKPRPNRIQILDQLYAAENAIGIIASGYIDAVVYNKQKIVGVRTPAN